MAEEAWSMAEEAWSMAEEAWVGSMAEEAWDAAGAAAGSRLSAGGRLYLWRTGRFMVTWGPGRDSTGAWRHTGTCPRFGSKNPSRKIPSIA